MSTVSRMLERMMKPDTLRGSGVTCDRCQYDERASRGTTTHGIIKEVEKVLWPIFFFHLSILACVGCKTIELDDLGRHQDGGQLKRRRDSGVQVRVVKIRLWDAAPRIQELGGIKRFEYCKTALKKLQIMVGKQKKRNLTWHIPLARFREVQHRRIREIP